MAYMHIYIHMYIYFLNIRYRVYGVWYTVHMSRVYIYEQVKWRRSLQELLAASDDDILRILKADKLLPEWKGAVCPRCNEGRLGALLTRPSGGLAHRCSRKHCQQYITPLELHPLFAKTMGPEGHSIQVQATALLLRLVNVPLSNIHLLTKINHKSIERLSRNLLLLCKGHVQEAEKVIKFGGAGRAWKDVEVDEATFDKRTLNPEELTVEHAVGAMGWHCSKR